MEKMRFFVPVRLALKDGEPVQEIEDIEQALRFLRSWPVDRRGPVYQAAFNGCTAAREGYLTAEEARKALSGFARITGILERDASHPAPVGVANKGRHLTR
jgi:hypothetical protein